MVVCLMSTVWMSTVWMSTIFQSYRGGQLFLVEETGGPVENHRTVTSH